MATTPALLKVDGLHAGYGRAEVLSGIAIEAARGSVVAVVGPNGAGKSTLLNALMGVLPARGEIVFDGEPVQRLPLEQRVQRVDLQQGHGVGNFGRHQCSTPR